jgi:ATP-binding cassette, subfamily F, member 3
MLHVSDLAKRYGESLLFEQASFVMNAGERVGLVGPNGCGKTTLLSILVGQEQPDRGSVRLNVPPDRVGYLPQGLALDPDRTVGDLLYDESLDERHWLGEVESLARAMGEADRDELADIQRSYAHALDRLATATSVMPQHEIDTILAGLGLSDVELDTPVRILSGGQKTRLGLARILLQGPALLMLDEPTNHLDIEALEWLESYLATYRGALLVVSHDRTFMDNTIQTVLEMNTETHAITAYPGNYSAYADAKRAEREKRRQEYADQQERIARLESAIQQWKGQASRIEAETIDFHYRKQAKKIARQGVIRQRRLERMLDSEELMEKPRQGWEMRLEFVNTPSSGQDVLLIEGLSKAFDERELFRDVNLTLRRGERIALVGPNGAGKTTLLRIITGEQEPNAGRVRIGSNVRIGYLAQEQETLDADHHALEAVQRAAGLSETDARRFLHYYLFSGDDVFTPVGALSYGERSRLSLGLLVLKGCNLLLLDEPINHLDIPSRERFEEALAGFEGTVLAVVHDRYFIQRFATGVWALRDGGIRAYPELGQALRAASA